jgi:hypothetical protein
LPFGPFFLGLVSTVGEAIFKFPLLRGLDVAGHLIHVLDLVRVRLLVKFLLPGYILGSVFAPGTSVFLCAGVLKRFQPPHMRILSAPLITFFQSGVQGISMSGTS